MHLHKNVSNRLAWLAALLALAAAGCSSGSAQPGGPAAVPEVAAITIQPQRVELTTELPGRTVAVPGGGNPAAGQWHH